MQNKKKERSVKSLVDLYTVVIGVSISLSLITLIDRTKGLESVTLAGSLLFLAFCVTLFPFYHGALRHLDDAYIENESPNIKDGALIIDFILLFMHALAFVVLSFLLQKPAQFAWLLALLLAIDVVWGLFAHFGSSSNTTKLTAEFKWTLINLVFVGVAICFLMAFDISLSTSTDQLKLATFVAVACVIRSLVDYVWCYKFYFPPK